VKQYHRVTILNRRVVTHIIRGRKHSNRGGKKFFISYESAETKHNIQETSLFNWGHDLSWRAKVGAFGIRGVGWDIT